MSHYFEGTGKGLSGWIDSSMKDDVDFVLFVEMLRSNEFQKFATFFVEQPAVAQVQNFCIFDLFTFVLAAGTIDMFMEILLASY
jgi:hypothetical protein